MKDQSEAQNQDHLDAVIAAPASHKIVLENDQVRILEVIILPGQKEPMHVHSRPSIMIVGSSTRIRYYDQDGVGKEFPEKNVSAEKSEVGWMGPEGLHAVENLDTHKTYRAIRIELKKQNS